VRASGRTIASGLAVFVAITDVRASPSSASVAAVSEPAHGQRQGLAVVPLVIDGDVAEYARSDLEQHLMLGLVRAGGRLLTPEQVVSQRPGAATCSEAVCWKLAAEALGVRWFVRASVTVDGRDYDITLTIIDGLDGSTVASRSAECDVCGTSEVGRRLTDEARAIVAELDAVPDAVAVLRVDTDPPGALAHIDGVAAGRTPLVRTVTPGKHEVTVSRDGYVSRTQSVTADAGGRSVLDFDLEPSARPVHPAWGWTTLALGVGGLATGIALLAIDGTPHAPSCDVRDINGRCRRQWNTLGSGAAVTVVSALAVTAGVVLLVVSHRRKKLRATRVGVDLGGIAIAF
jgi:hypothetical protein